MRRLSWALMAGSLAAATVSPAAMAQQRAPASAEAAPTEDQRKAQEHFQRAKELYSTGKYSEAIAELEVARGLDPKAKDLVMNLGIVNEKLGKYDDAIGLLKTYLEMDGVTPAERTKVEGMIKRIEGAKQSAPTTPTTPATGPTTKEPSPPGETPPSPPPRGRVDALTIAAGSVAVVGLGLGTGLGIYALSARPKDGFVTGRDGSYAELQQKTDDAHTTAIVADVSLAVGVVAALATAWLYFGRPKDITKPASGTARTTSRGRIMITPSAGLTSGAVFVGGTF